MLERFTDEAQRVVLRAYQDARGLGHHHLEPVHLLLGLFGVDDAIAARALIELDCTREGTRGQIETHLGGGEGPPPDHVPFTAAAKDVLEQSLRKAGERGDARIGPAHLLLALAELPESSTETVLSTQGTTPDELRSRVLTLLGNKPD